MKRLEGYTPTQYAIIQTVFHKKAVSRAELAEELHVSNLTVINGIRKLLEDGVLIESGIVPCESRGRKVTLLSVNPEFCYFLSVDIGASSTRLAVVRFDGTVLSCTRIMNTAGTVFSVYITPEILRNEIDAVLDKYGRDKIKALCFCISGVVDYQKKIMRFSPNISGWTGLDFEAEFGAYFDLPVYLDSSGRCSALAEYRFGCGKDASSMVFVSIGHSICTGIIIEGQLMRGRNGAAGELGHVLAVEECPENPKCTCGHSNCLEMFTTVPMIRLAVLDKFRKREAETGEEMPSQISHLWMKKAYEAGDPCVCETVEGAAHVLGKAIANLANILNPEKIIFGGGTIHAFPDMARIVSEDIAKYSLNIISDHISVEITQLGADSAVIGAALLAIHDMIH